MIEGVQELRPFFRTGNHDVEFTEFAELSPDDLPVQKGHVRCAHKGSLVPDFPESAIDSHQGAATLPLVGYHRQPEELIFLRRVGNENDLIEQGHDDIGRSLDDRRFVDFQQRLVRRQSSSFSSGQDQARGSHFFKVGSSHADFRH